MSDAMFRPASRESAPAGPPRRVFWSSSAPARRARSAPGVPHLHVHHQADLPDESRTAPIPKSSFTSMMPSPRTSMWFRRGSPGPYPTSTSPGRYFISTISSATEVWPRLTSSSAHSDFPMPASRGSVPRGRRSPPRLHVQQRAIDR